MTKVLKTYLLLVGLLASTVYADPFAPAPELTNSSPAMSPSNTTMRGNPQFLSVQQAFQVTVEVEEQQLVFDWAIAEGYYLYQHGFKFQPVQDGIQLATPEFATGINKWDEFFEADLEVYYQQTRVRVPFSSNLKTFKLQFESQGCADAGLCYPPRKQWLSVDNGTVSITATAPKSATTVQSKNTLSTPLWLVLILALSGGLILNLMPCVFPVLSIKVLSFTRSHQTTGEKQLHGLAYTLGVVASFLVIASLMLSLRTAGEAIGWGFQLQSSGFVIALIYLFTIIGLSLSGYLNVGTGLMSLGQSSQVDHSLSSSFLTGVLATTVASPCTAPFMGPALGYAIAQPTFVALLVFACLGLGMALPFVALTWIPTLANKLPKPGQWMDSLKQFLAFPMYLTAIWLLWVAGRQTGVDTVIAICAGLLMIVMAIWLWQLATKTASKFNKLLAVALLIGALIAPQFSLNKTDPGWQPYSPQRLASLRNAGLPVFINLTADWCITCLVNEKVAMTDRFYQTMDNHGMAYLKGDWTNKDPQITQLLNQYQRNGVPLYLVFPRGSGSAEVLPQILLESSLIDAINRAN
jgi:thiol:disulfide interchange protein